MDRGATTAVACALLAVLAGCRGEAHAVHGSTPGYVPTAWTASGPRAGDTTVVLWAFRTEDCLSCMGVDYDVRRVQARFGRAVPVIALHVGSVEQSAIPRSYFRARRLRVDRAVTVAPSEFGERYPDTSLPALYLLQGRRVVWSTSSNGPTRASPVRLDSLVERFARPPPRSRSGSPIITGEES